MLYPLSYEGNVPSVENGANGAAIVTFLHHLMGNTDIARTDAAPTDDRPRARRSSRCHNGR